MRKSIFLLSVLSLCLADFGAFAATARSSRTVGATPAETTEDVTEKNASSSRQNSRKRETPNPELKARVASQSTVSKTTPVSARSAARPKVTNTTEQQSVKARAGATQKVINTGTKVAVATENTAIPEECQNAFYGCMDAFCMLDNATGGRCQCSDQITELDAVLEDILRLDEQSYVMATEGVERIQMGEAEDQIMARAKEAGEKAVADNKESEANKRRVRTLDLSIFDNNIFNEIEGVDDIFDSGSMQQTLVEKKGKALLNASNSMCSEQIPNECKKYNSMLSLVYAQKVKSDCMAYENSLKAQKNQSQQKLQTAQKALRDAALDEYKNQNKYATAGECAIAFAQCVQTTGECGEDYTGCVTFAARENMTNSSKSGSVAKQTRIKGTVSGADITLAASTMEQLLSKKLICESVVKQCVNANKNDAVWDLFLRNEAPALKSAELVAEQDLRSNCIPKAAECFKNACKSKFGEQDEESYDMCLSNPETYKTLCKVELEPCLEATGGSFGDPKASSLWKGLVAMLSAMKVDACTKEIKDCITDRCGKDYSECVGLTTEAIGNICPVQTLTACASDGDYADGVGGTNDEAIRAYVAQIAQGIALSIDNAMTKTCQNAVDEAMIKVCGDTETCEFSDGKILGTDVLKYQIKIGDGDFTDRNLVADNAITKNFETQILGEGLFSVIGLKQNNRSTGIGRYQFTVPYNAEDDQKTLMESMNSVLRTKLEIIESDPTVQYCMTGRKVEGFYSDSSFGATDEGRFPNLLNSTATTIASGILAAVATEYETEMAEIQDKIAKDKARFANISNQQKCEAYNRQGCKRAESCTYRRDAVYDPSTSTCNVTSYREYCPYGSWAGEYCLVYKVTNTYVTTFVCNDAECEPPTDSLFAN